MESAHNDSKSLATVWHGDGREKALQTHILMTPALKGQPMAILSEIDAWAAANGHCMMTIGPDRSTSIIEIIRSTHPKIMAEIGGYIGYSAILFGHEVRKAGGTRYISFELNDEYASIAKSLVEFAGLGNFVEILRGPSSQSLCRFHEEDRNKGLRFDVLFVDHAEELYLADLKGEEQKSMQDGSRRMTRMKQNGYPVSFRTGTRNFIVSAFEAIFSTITSAMDKLCWLLKTAFRRFIAGIPRTTLHQHVNIICEKAISSSLQLVPAVLMAICSTNGKGTRSRGDKMLD
ncbi:hypothetical protein AnigIFM63326_007670 [Aspergillus niger]|nr:hypothetical protein AnigIFM63326_007670 [Aspergillus niger]